MYVVYLLRCADNTLYCGQTNNLKRRLKEHSSGGTRSARYTKTRQPISLVYSEKHLTIGDALRRERKIKTWTKKRKELLISKKLLKKPIKKRNRPR